MCIHICIYQRLGCESKRDFISFHGGLLHGGVHCTRGVQGVYKYFSADGRSFLLNDMTMHVIT